MSKHTPGPWDWQRPFRRNLAKCLSGGGRPLLRCIDVSDADANLIAAAPDLLEALVMVRDADEDCKRDGLPTIPPAARAKIDAAIAKAEGT